MNLIYLREYYWLSYNMASDRYNKYDKHSDSGFQWEHVEESLKQYSNMQLAYGIDTGISYLQGDYNGSYRENRPNYVLPDDIESLIYTEFLNVVFSGASRLASGYTCVI